MQRWVASLNINNSTTRIKGCNLFKFGLTTHKIQYIYTCPICDKHFRTLTGTSIRRDMKRWPSSLNKVCNIKFCSQNYQLAWFILFTSAPCIIKNSKASGLPEAATCSGASPFVSSIWKRIKYNQFNIRDLLNKLSHLTHRIYIFSSGK